MFNEGFPPVPAKLVAKILRLDFVDMAELLRDNIEAERRRAAQGESPSSNTPRPPRREVPDILSWIQCFGIYISVIATKYPGKVQSMLAYQTMLVREACRCGAGGWLAYDTAFRQQAATDPDCDWAKLNSSIYPVTFMAQATGKGRCSPHCLEPDHSAEECALSPRPRQIVRYGPVASRWRASGIARLDPSPKVRVVGQHVAEREGRESMPSATHSMTANVVSRGPAAISTTASGAVLRTTQLANAPQRGRRRGAGEHKWHCGRPGGLKTGHSM